MRLKEMLDIAFMQVGLGRTGDIPKDVRLHAIDLMNLEYETLWNFHTWDSKKKFDLEVTSSTGTIVLPNNVELIRAVRNGAIPLRPINEVRASDFFPFSLDSNGSPFGYEYLNPSPVLVQPAAADTLTIESSDAADTGTSFPVKIDGLVSGLDNSEEIDLNGTTPVPTILTYSEISHIVKPLTTGRVTIKDAGGSTLGDIAPWDFRGFYKRIRTIPGVDTATTFQFKAIRRFERLVSENDATQIAEMDAALVNRLIARLYGLKEDDERATVAFRNSAAEVKIAQRSIEEHQPRDHAIVPHRGFFGDVNESDSFSRNTDMNTGNFGNF